MTSEELKELLHYDPETGVFTWKVSRGGQFEGDVAGCTCYGYVKININRKRYRAHRLVWLYMFGVWPSNQIDHINGVRNDNRLSNLREATNAENRQNTGVRSDNSSGYTGVCWHNLTKKWMEKIQVNGITRHIGLFDTPEEAYEAYLKAKANLHKFQPVPREVITE